MDEERIPIRTATIRVDALLKFSGLASTGGEAKLRVQSGRVRVNGAVETRRGRELAPGDCLELLDEAGDPERALRVVDSAAEASSP